MNGETFWNINANVLIAGGLLAIAFLLYYIAFVKDESKRISKTKSKR